MEDLQIISDCMEEIKSFAKTNNNEISLFVVQEIIKSKKARIDEDLLNKAVDQLQEQGIQLLPLDTDEG